MFSKIQDGVLVGFLSTFVNKYLFMLFTLWLFSPCEKEQGDGLLHAIRGDGFKSLVSWFLLLGLPVVCYALSAVIFCLDFDYFIFLLLFPCQVFFLLFINLF
jgi:hypothetical protein